MINNPKDFFQQIQNLCEELGLKMKAISESIVSMLSKSDAESTYLKKTDAQFTYLGKTAKAESAKTADTATSATSATKATQDGNGAVISSTYLKSATASSTYLTKSDAQATYLGKDAKAQSATFADSATTATSATSALKATQDADGNVIGGTYLKKTEKAASATTADSATKATQDGSGNNIEATYAKKSEIPSVPEVDVSGLIPKTGDRGQLSGYEQVAYAQEVFGAEGATVEVSENLPDSIMAAHSYNFRLSAPEEFGRTWTKVIVCGTAPSSVWMSGYWTWANEEVPTLEGQGYLVCHWAGVMGVASYVHTYEFIDPEWPV